MSLKEFYRGTRRWRRVYAPRANAAAVRLASRVGTIAMIVSLLSLFPHLRDAQRRYVALPLTVYEAGEEV